MRTIRTIALLAFIAGALFVGMTIRATFEAGNYYQTVMISLSAVAAVLTIRYAKRLGLIKEEDNAKKTKP
jgi:membrane protein implicated in regulation of membrane protease activity